MRLMLALLGLCLCPSCATAGAPPIDVVTVVPSAGPFTLTGLTAPGGAAQRIAIADGRITAVGPAASGGPEVDLAGYFVAPAFIDSHVHLTYLPRAAEMAAAGIAAAVDLAAPIGSLAAPPTELRLLGSGPMVTAVGDYPTQGWGAGGYGIECATTAEAIAAVDLLADAGAALIKVPLHGEPELTPQMLAAVVDRAHARGLKVVAHALFEDGALRAAAAGVDALAHTPVQSLSDAASQAWAGRVVISTLRAFGGSEAAIESLRRLRAAGAMVLYGTDFGNTRTAGIDGDELALLESAGLDGAAILAAGTWDAAAFWGLDDLGALAVGKAASLLLLDADPHVDPSTLARPAGVLLDGRPVEQASSAGWP